MLWWTLQQLKSSNPDVRVKAARSLAASKANRAVPSLIKSLQDENQQVRLAVIGALGAIGHPASVEPLISALIQVPKTAKSGTESQSIVEALAGVGSAAVKPLSQALSSDDREARRCDDLGVRSVRNQKHRSDRHKRRRIEFHIRERD